MKPKMTFAFAAQLVLIVFYIVLTVAFARRRTTWPMSVYYLGCFIKDTAVFALGWYLTHK